MKCFRCHRTFEPSDEEIAHAKEFGKREGSPYFVECCLPKYCCWDCFKLATHFKSHGNKERLRKAKDRNRWAYHIGELPPMPGTQEARRDEESYRKKMERSCMKRPPKTGHSGFSEGSMCNPPILPSEAFFGKARDRILDEGSTHLGGDDGDKYNFPDE